MKSRPVSFVTYFSPSVSFIGCLEATVGVIKNSVKVCLKGKGKISGYRLGNTCFGE